MTDADVVDLSPMPEGQMSLPDNMPDVLVAAGDQAADEFIKQSQACADQLQGACVKQVYMLSPDEISLHSVRFIGGGS